MGRVRWIAMATVIAAAGAGAVGRPAGATRIAGTPGPTVPAGYVALVDDTQAIGVIVPQTWTQIDTATAVDPTGAPVPYIAAAPDIESFLTTFDTPGVQFMSFPFEADPQVLVDAYGLVSGCQSVTVEPYADPVFTGVVQVGTACGAGTASWKMVVASPASQARTVVVQVQITGPAEQAAMDNVLNSFNLVGGSTSTPAPATTAATPTMPAAATAVPTVPTVTVAAPTVPLATVAAPTVAVATVAVPTAVVPTVPGSSLVPATVAAGPATTGAAGASSITVVDDTGTVSVDVPSTWTQSETAPSEAGLPFLLAGPDLGAYLSTDPAVALSVPAVLIRSTTEITDPASSVAFIAGALAGACTPKDLQSFDDNVYVGSMQVFSDCGGTSTFMVIIVASPPSQVGTITVVVQAQDVNDPALALILGSFQIIE